MRSTLPNQLTVLRLFLAGAFLLTLNSYRYPHGPHWILVAAFVIFIIAGVTDWLDGYLARKWKVESTFGRVMDPLCDKLLVIGAFIALAGARFAMPDAVGEGKIVNMISGVYPWMVVLILFRELLVTGIRGEVEGRGVAFGASIWGKLKTVFQLVGVPTILAIVWFDPHKQGHEWAGWVRDGLVYAIVISTLLSGWPYVTSSLRMMRESK
ncbi:MAG: CDP-alcohol phosphatidyltransferase family protein [Phycisphaeraceae bacterium]|nr:CDP-alcohol phosphatidyltransferase family protein [Phycisphaeraceae bacterium]